MEKFINPYNFVPLSQKEPVRSDKTDENEKLYTGKITYRIKTRAPLFIPNTSNDKIFGIKGEEDTEEEYHKNFDFFSYEDLSGKSYNENGYEPVIPGSEIRGMVRSIYEAMTNSCVSSIDENVRLTKRVVERFQAGVLVKTEEGYELYKAQKDYLYRVNGREDFSVHSFRDKELPVDGSEVHFCEDKRSAPNRPPYAKPLACKISEAADENHRIGYLIKGESGPELTKNEWASQCDSCPKRTIEKCRRDKSQRDENGNSVNRCYFLEKHCAHIFTKGSIVKKFTRKEAEDIVDRMDAVLNLYQAKEKKYGEYKESWNRLKESSLKDKINHGIAVYFSSVDGIYYVSPACITREVYKNTFKEILGGHRSCNDKNLCPACRLFGTVTDTMQSASRIRFADAYIVAEDGKEKWKDYYMEPVTLYELSSPKLSTTEFYLQRPSDNQGDVINWTYDYYVVLGEDKKPIVKTYIPVISGRKFYWHNPDGISMVLNNQNKIRRNERNKTIRPVKEGVEFEGTLFFDGITDKQLNELITILNISSMEKDNNRERYALKLGSAKPLGFGSVIMNVEDVTYRTVLNEASGQIEYKPNNPYDFHNVKITDDIRQTGILKILDVGAVEGKIHYPYEHSDDSEEEEGFNWFTHNRAAYKMKKTEHSIELWNPEKSPNSRKQIVFQKHMMPLEPELKTVVVRPGKQELRDTGNNIQTNDVIECVITKIKDRKKGIAWIKYGARKGTIFGLPGNVSEGKHVKMKVNKINDSNMIYGDYHDN